MFQITMRSSRGSLGKKEKATSEDCAVDVCVEMGDSNDVRAEDRDDVSNASDISMSESGRDMVVFWAWAFKPDVNDMLLLCLWFGRFG
jgi:hypothetical protein